MFQITSDHQYKNISDWFVLQIGFILVSDWFQIGRNNFRLRLQISDFFRLLQIHFRLAVFKKNVSEWQSEKSFQTLVWKMVKTSDFVLIFQIASDWLELEVCKYQRGRNLRFQQESSGRIKCFVQQISISDDGKDFSHFFCSHFGRGLITQSSGGRILKDEDSQSEKKLIRYCQQPNTSVSNIILGSFMWQRSRYGKTCKQQVLLQPILQPRIQKTQEGCPRS